MDEPLLRKVCEQLEFYFGDENLANDTFMLAQLGRADVNATDSPRGQGGGGVLQPEPELAMGTPPRTKQQAAATLEDLHSTPPGSGSGSGSPGGVDSVLHTPGHTPGTDTPVQRELFTAPLTDPLGVSGR